MGSGTGGHMAPLSTPSAPGRHPPSLFLATVLPPKAAIDADGSAVEEMAPSSPSEAAGYAVEEMAPSSPPEAAADAEEDLAALLSLSRATTMASRGELQQRRPDLLPPAPSPTAATRSGHLPPFPMACSSVVRHGDTAAPGVSVDVLMAATAASLASPPTAAMLAAAALESLTPVGPTLPVVGG
jgi:hypothetical protein